MFKIYDGRKNFFQWDLNQKVIVAEKVDRVHFEIGGKIEATEVKEEDGTFVADVPNIILQIAGKLLVYAYIMGEGDEESITKVKDCFSINGRAKPPDYVYTETEVLSYETIRKELADIEKRLKKVEETGGGGGGISFTTDETLSLENGVLSVNRATELEEDNTLPITSAAVAATVGNIEILLKTI